MECGIMQNSLCWLAGFCKYWSTYKLGPSLVLIQSASLDSFPNAEVDSHHHQSPGPLSLPLFTPHTSVSHIDVISKFCQQYNLSLSSFSSCGLLMSHAAAMTVEKL